MANLELAALLGLVLASTACAGSNRLSQTAEAQQKIERAIATRQVDRQPTVPGGLPSDTGLVYLEQDRIHNLCTAEQAREAQRHDRDWQVAGTCFGPRSFVY
jgi:hypothetical protein